jgi:hypothetical protein
MPIKVFVSYSHSDEALRDRLAKHLKPLEREGHIFPWHDRKILAGSEFDDEIMTELESAQIILLLISSDFMSSDYCVGREMKRAMERHEERSARVIPIILRPVDWHRSPFGKLRASPKDGKPVTSWADADEAFLDIVQGIRILVYSLNSATAKTDNEHESHAEIGAVNTDSLDLVHVSLNYIRHGWSPKPLRSALGLSEVKPIQVIVDGTTIEKMGVGETIRFTIVPGAHSIQLRHAWATSNLLSVTANPGEPVHLEGSLSYYDPATKPGRKLQFAFGIGESVTLKRIS